MKKGNNRSNGLASKNQQKNGFGSMQEKRMEQGKGSMQQPKSNGQYKNEPSKRMESGKGEKSMNGSKGFKQNEESKNSNQSKYFGNYKKTSANNGSEDIHYKKCCGNCRCK